MSLEVMKGKIDRKSIYEERRGRGERTGADERKFGLERKE